MNNVALSHDRSIAIVKGICIVLMVIGHSGGRENYVSDLFSFFRMPCFFFASGYLFKEKYLDSPRQFISKRFKGLWWKFVEYSLLFLLCHHLFYRLHIYQYDYTYEDYMSKLFHIITMTGTEQLLGGYWFLKDLLYGSIIGLCFLMVESFVLKHFTIERKVSLSAGILIFVLFLVYSNIYIPFLIPTIGTHAFLACAFYLSGVFAHRYGILEKLRTFNSALPCMIVLVTVSLFFHGSMSSVGIDAVFYYFSAFFGIVLVNYCANKISTVKNRFFCIMDRLLNYIGTKTFHILTFHFLGFKLLAAAVILFSSKYCIDDLASFPVLSTGIPGLWIVYTVISISFSLAVSYLLDKAGNIFRRTEKR